MNLKHSSLPLNVLGDLGEPLKRNPGRDLQVTAAPLGRCNTSRLLGHHQ